MCNSIDFPPVKAGFHYLVGFFPLDLSNTVKYIMFIQYKGKHDIRNILHVQDMTENEKPRNSLEKAITLNFVKTKNRELPIDFKGMLNNGLLN